MKSEQFLDYPFDLYQRTRDIQEIIGIIGSGYKGGKLKILDVGGFRFDAENRDNLLLKEFLPEHEIFSLDLQDSKVQGYIKGDARHLPVKENGVDVVVSADVLEHIPPQDRNTFINNLLHSAKNFVILLAPFYSKETVLAEQILFEFIRKVLHAEQEQLREHINNQLPKMDDVVRFCSEGGLSYTSFDSGNLNNWLTFMMVKHYLLSIPESENLQRLLDQFYNLNFYKSDHGGAGYRKVFVIAKNSKSTGILKKIEKHFKEYAGVFKNSEFDQGELNRAGMLLNLEALRTRGLIEQKEALIVHQAAIIREFNSMKITRLYRVIQFLGKVLVSPIIGLLGLIKSTVIAIGKLFKRKKRG